MLGRGASRGHQTQLGDPERAHAIPPIGFAGERLACIHDSDQTFGCAGEGQAKMFQNLAAGPLARWTAVPVGVRPALRQPLNFSADLFKLRRQLSTPRPGAEWCCHFPSQQYEPKTQLLQSLFFQAASRRVNNLVTTRRSSTKSRNSRCRDSSSGARRIEEGCTVASTWGAASKGSS